jgi:cytochrome P450
MGVIVLITCPHRATGPAWEENEQTGVFSLKASEPYFDHELDGWILSRHADVLAAFSCADLQMIGAASRTSGQVVDERARLKMRAETRAALSPERLLSWRRLTLLHARECAAKFAPGQPLDLIRDYAEPVCLALAFLATEPLPAPGHDFNALAAEVAMAAAEPLDETAKRAAKIATAQLRPFFRTGPEPLRESGFVALARTTVSILGNAWFALARHPQQWQRLRAQPELVSRALEELQRFTGLTRLLFRRALCDTTLNGLKVRKGERVVLCLLAANRDPDRFSNPHQLFVERPGIGHLSLGTGRHACVGAPLVRLATTTATLALVERFSSIQLLEPVKWRGGSGYLAPVSLMVAAT